MYGLHESTTIMDPTDDFTVPLVLLSFRASLAAVENTIQVRCARGKRTEKLHRCSALLVAPLPRHGARLLVASYQRAWAWSLVARVSSNRNTRGAVEPLSCSVHRSSWSEGVTAHGISSSADGR